MGILPPIWRLFCYKWRMLRSLKLLFVLALRSCCSRRDLLLENWLSGSSSPSETEASSPAICRTEQIVLGDIAAPLAGMETSVDSCPARDRCSLASAGFKLYWTWLSRHRNRAGRKCVSRELRELIFRMVAENPTGAHRAFMVS